MAYKKYEILYNWDEDLGDFRCETFLSIKDLRDYFLQIRGFPTIVTLGELSGEGQSGGRFIHEIAKQLESEIIQDIGEDEYIKTMRKLMG